MVDHATRFVETFTGTTAEKLGGRSAWSDPYTLAVWLSWPQFIALLLGLQLGMNLFFALLYWLHPHGVANARPGSLADAFFFSLETMATVGYGEMYPSDLYTHVVTSVEIMTGIAFIAIITGLTFVRFSRPKPCFAFADCAVICRNDGVETLMLRVAHATRGALVDAEAQLSVLLAETTQEGLSIRRSHPLPLVRDRLQVFAFSWMLMHRLDETSPVHGLTREEVIKRDGRLFLTIKGRDPRLGADVQDVRVYRPDDVRFGQKFVDIVQLEEARNTLRLDLRNISETVAE